MTKNLSEIRVANRCPVPIVRGVNWNWKWFRAMALVALLALGSGCGGIHASKSVSPLDFLLPGSGFLRTDMARPPTASPSGVPATEPMMPAASAPVVPVS